MLTISKLLAEQQADDESQDRMFLENQELVLQLREALLHLLICAEISPDAKLPINQVHIQRAYELLEKTK